MAKKITFEEAVKSLWTECLEWGREAHPFEVLMSFAFRKSDAIYAWEDADKKAKQCERLGLALVHLGERLLGE